MLSGIRGGFFINDSYLFWSRGTRVFICDDSVYIFVE